MPRIPHTRTQRPAWMPRVPLLRLLIGLVLCGGSVANADEADSGVRVQVIVNRSVETDSLSRYKLRTLFGMRLPSWPNGDAARVFVLPDEHPLHRRFAKQRLGVFPHQLRRAWNNLIYSGLGQAPVEVATEQELVDRVARTPGAIGYATAGEENAQTRILPIQ